MAPQPWTTDEQSAFLAGWIDRYLTYQKDGNLDAFWALLHEGWFRQWPVRDMHVAVDQLSDEAKIATGVALLAKRKVLGERKVSDNCCTDHYD